ncbi:hypothetical protein WN944_007620 [Citrus x changshan-huyou]|uniref:Uncharacterized protein n=1 Tax=Citrus x changshan-huyou TaxID=2935761 RepID=A0AAP0MRI0_9ROSI
MALSRYDVILGMEFLYNAEVHVHPHLSCIWIGGMEEPCMVECEYLNASRLEPSLLTTNGGLIGGNSEMMSLVEERVQVAEGLDEITTMSRGFVAGESLGPQLNKLPDINMDQDEGESEAKSLTEDSNYWKTHHSENVGDILSGTSCNEYLLNKGNYGCFKKEAWGFKHFKSASGVPVITSWWAIWFMMVLLGAAALFSVFGCACGSREHHVLSEDLRDSRLARSGTCVAVNSMGVSAFLGHKTTSAGVCCRIRGVHKQGLGQAQRFGDSQEGTIGSENGWWVYHWHGVITGVKNDSTRAEHPGDQGMTQRMSGEPNIGMRVCAREGSIGFVMAMCGGGYGERDFPVDEDVALFRRGRFVTTVSHGGQLS